MGHYYILSSKGINSVFAAPEKSLTFTSFRLKMTESAFGLRARDPRFWTDTIYPMHAKGMTRTHLVDSFQKFHHVFASKVDDLRARAAHGSVEIDLVQWVTDAVFDAGLAAVWGLEFVKRVSDPTNAFHKMLDRFDNSFPIVASGLIPPFLYPLVKPTRDFTQSRDALKRILSVFVQDGTPGLDDGVIYDITQAVMREKFSPDDAASFLLTILWALQRTLTSRLLFCSDLGVENTPFATVALFVRALQMSGLVERLRAELDASGALRGGDIDESKLHDSTPLMMSCIYETLRLETSAISFRVRSIPTHHSLVFFLYLIRGIVRQRRPHNRRFRRPGASTRSPTQRRLCHGSLARTAYRSTRQLGAVGSREVPPAHWRPGGTYDFVERVPRVWRRSVHGR